MNEEEHRRSLERAFLTIGLQFGELERKLDEEIKSRINWEKAYVKADKEIAELQQKVSNPEWLDVLVLDLMKPQMDEFNRLIHKSTHINSCIETSGKIENRLTELEEKLELLEEYQKVDNEAIRSLKEDFKKFKHDTAKIVMERDLK